jgi:hypothetical protein
MPAPRPDAEGPEHLLLAIAKSYPAPARDLTPPNCEYSLTEGAWILQDADTLLVEVPGHPMQATKKADLETGEDQKPT